MRIATLQFAPRLGKVESNIRRADELLNRAMKNRFKDDRRQLDLLVLPELAFSGYNFSSVSTIKPHLEPTEAGPTAEWARSAARRLGCAVCVGYPEIRRRTGSAPTAEETERDDDAPQSNQSRFNSALFVDSTGGTLLNYQKRFLYYTDEPWAAEGENGKGYLSLPIPRHGLSEQSDTSQEPAASRKPDGNPPSSPPLELPATTTTPTAVGICMDINPYKFLAPYSSYEFATHVLDSGAKLVVLSMAWLTLLPADELNSAALAGKPDMDTFRYWVGRFWPFVSGENWDGGEIVIVFANRCGEEEGLEGKEEARYAGTSCVLAIRRPPGKTKDLADAEIVVWEMLGRAEEGMCFADTDSEPKMTFRVK